MELGAQTLEPGCLGFKCDPDLPFISYVALGHLTQSLCASTPLSLKQWYLPHRAWRGLTARIHAEHLESMPGTGYQFLSHPDPWMQPPRFPVLLLSSTDCHHSVPAPLPGFSLLWVLAPQEWSGGGEYCLLDEHFA